MKIDIILIILLFSLTLLVLGYFLKARISAAIEWRYKELEKRQMKLESMISGASESIVNAVYLNSSKFKFPVPLGGPSIDADHTRLLTFLLQLKKPKKILELGSGSSTVLIARLLRDLGAPPDSHVAVDHEPVFLNLTRELCTVNGVEEGIHFEYCPLAEVQGHSLKWYQISQNIKDRGPFDLILVDGPPAYTEQTQIARHPALPELVDYLSTDGVLLLDDANRDGERQVQSRWRDRFPELKFHHSESGKGVLMVSRKELF